MSKFGLKAEELREPLERWCYFLRHAEGLEPDALPKTLRTPEIEQAVETLRAMMRDAVQQEQYEAWLKARRDRDALIKDVRREGLIEGRKEGLAEGEQNGLELGLELKFGEAGLKLMDPIRSIHDLAKLQDLRRFLKTAQTLDEFRSHLNGN